MRKLMSALVSTAIIGASLAGAALARHGHRDNDPRRDYVQSYCNDHSRSRDCRAWVKHGNGWGDRDYRGFYERNYASRQDAAIAALFGIVLTSRTGQYDNRGHDGRYNDGRYNDGRGYGDNGRGYNHAAACAARYDSYRAADDTFIGEDGRSYYCPL